MTYRRALAWATSLPLIAMAIPPYIVVVALCLPVYLLTGWDNLVGFDDDDESEDGP